MLIMMHVTILNFGSSIGLRTNKTQLYLDPLQLCIMIMNVVYAACNIEYSVINHANKITVCRIALCDQIFKCAHSINYIRLYMING